MSRASDLPGFAAFFPNAPRAAKDKAKEREKVKSHKIDSPIFRAVGDTKLGLSNNRIENIPPRSDGDPALPQADDAESLQGDILNAVGSASSHASSVSTVFSMSGLQSNMATLAGSRNMNSLTPLTNIDSSPNRVPSPQQLKLGALSEINYKSVANDVLPTEPAVADIPPADPRVYARGPIDSVKGNICTYDPELDANLSKDKKRKAKPIYKEFGLVCTLQSAGSVILLV
jgi:histone-lysine N-methyltransferase SETD1